MISEHMKKYSFFIFFIFSLLYNCKGQNTLTPRIIRFERGDLIDQNSICPIDSTIYSGTFNGKDLFFQNNGFCIKKNIVNRQETTDSIGTGTFEIDFKKLNIKTGEAVKVEIIHSKDCISFKFLNQEVLKP